MHEPPGRFSIYPSRAGQGSRCNARTDPAPDIPEKIAKELASELPKLLHRRVDGSETPFR
jgi:hypothetical protein